MPADTTCSLLSMDWAENSDIQYLFALEGSCYRSASGADLAKHIGIVNGLCGSNTLTHQVNA